MVKRANRFMLLLVLYMQLLGVLIYFAAVFFENATGIKTNFQYLQAVTLILAFGVPFLLYFKITRQKISETIPLKRLEPGNVLLITAMSIFAVPAVMVVSAASSFFFENNAAVFLDEMTALPALTAILIAALIPAVFEEFIFRGVLLHELNSLSIKKTAVLSGFFFGLMHMDLQQFPYAIIMGFFFAYLVYYTKSIFAPVLSHFAVNAASVVTGYASGGGDVPFPIIPALIVSVPAFIFTYKYFISRNGKNVTEEIILSENENAQKIPTWEFWALIAVYLIVAAFTVF